MAWPVEHANHVHQRAFATAARTHDSHEFTFFNLQIDLVERQGSGIAEAVQLTDVLLVL